MGSFANFENFASMAMAEGKNAANYPLTRQGSIYSMTFDELQSMGSLGRDIGSLNMEELLKNLWSAEEIQANSTIGGNSSGSCNAPCPSGNLQRQGSLTLPRTISQKTVDDVWKELLKETGGGSKDESDNRFSNTFQREPTLGEITLEEFLSRAGVVREEIQQPFDKPSSNVCTGFSQQANKPNTNNGRFSGGFGRENGHNNGFTIDFQQPSPNKGMMGSNNHYKGYNNDFSFNLELNGNRAMSPPRPQPLYPEQTTLPFAATQPPRSRVATTSNVGVVNGCSLNSPTPITNSVVSISNAMNSPTPVTLNGMMNVSSSGMTNSVAAAMANPLNSPRAISHNTMMNISSSAMSNPLNSPRAISHDTMMNVSSSGMTNPVISMANPLNSIRAVNHVPTSVKTNSVRMPTSVTGHGGSPRNHVHQETSSKNSLDSPSLSSSPYAYNEGGQGRRSSATLDKQVERRRRRMIKNRESAARSRARKQEYITELEEEIAKLKEINRGLKEKQIELMNMQNNQEPESGKEVKRKRLRRTMTGQW